MTRTLKRLALLVALASGCGGTAPAPAQQASRGWTVNGKQDGDSPWLAEDGLQDRMQSTVLPYFEAHARKGSFTGRDGVRIEYVVLEHADEIGALVISSGRTESYLKYAELAYELRDVGVSIYLIDHRGQGFSGRMVEDSQKGYVYDFSDYVADFGTFMDSVVMVTPHAKLFGLAHSMGGTIMASYLEQQPGMFDAVVLSSPMMELNAGWLSETAAWAAAEAATAVGLGKLYAIGKGPYNAGAANDVSHSSTRYAVANDLVAAHPEIALGGPTYRWVEQAVEGERAARGDDAASIDTPILLLQSGADQIVLPGGQETFCSNAPNCTLQTIDGAGHELIQERDDLRVQALDAISAFFAQH
jgi:lysophospholipase